MPEKRLSELCKICSDNGFETTLDGPDMTVRAVNTLEDASEGEVSFLSNPKYISSLATTKAAAVVAQDGVDMPDGVSALRCKDPYAAITMAIITLHGYRKHPKWGVSEKAYIEPSAKIGRDANIAPGATVAADVVIGDGCTIYPGCYVGDRVRVGHECILYPNVVVYDDCVLGNRVTIHSGSVIGEDGLGYAPYEDKWIKIPQAGYAVIGDDVEIGANCAIDRATLGRTEIGSGTKFGNVIVIGHGTKVGPDCMFVGLIGVAGSAKIGKHVTIAGQSGVGGHITVGDDVSVAGQSGVQHDVEAGMKVFGFPAEEIGKARRSVMAVRKLPDWIKRVKQLEKELAQLRELVNENAKT